MLMTLPFELTVRSGSSSSSPAWRAYSMAGTGLISSSAAQKPPAQLGRGVSLYRVHVKHSAAAHQHVVQGQAVEKLNMSDAGKHHVVLSC